jgi:hypothetical protein
MALPHKALAPDLSDEQTLQMSLLREAAPALSFGRTAYLHLLRGLHQQIRQ